MRILWAVLCQDVFTSDDGGVEGMFNPLSTYVFEGKPDISQTPYAIPNSLIHAVLMCFNDSNLDGDFSISVGFLPPTGSKIASGGGYFHRLRVEPGGHAIFQLTLAPLYYEVDGDYEVAFAAYTEGGQLDNFSTVLHISAQ